MHLEGRPQITCIENCISQRPLQEDRHLVFMLIQSHQSCQARSCRCSCPFKETEAVKRFPTLTGNQRLWHHTPLFLRHCGESKSRHCGESKSMRYMLWGNIQLYSLIIWLCKTLASQQTIVSHKALALEASHTAVFYEMWHCAASALNSTNCQYTPFWLIEWVHASELPQFSQLHVSWSWI